MPVNMDYVHPIIQAFLEASRLGQERRRAEEDQKIEREKIASVEKQRADELKRETERDKRSAEVAKATLALNQAMRAEARSRGIRDDLLKGFPVVGIPRPESAPIQQPGSELYNRILRQDPSNWGEAFAPREMQIEIAPRIQAGDIDLPAISEVLPTPEAVQSGVYGMQAPLIQLKEQSAMNRLLGIERIRQAGARGLQEQKSTDALALEEKRGANRLAVAKLPRISIRIDPNSGKAEVPAQDLEQILSGTITREDMVKTTPMKDRLTVERSVMPYGRFVKESEAKKLNGLSKLGQVYSIYQQLDQAIDANDLPRIMSLGQEADNVASAVAKMKTEQVGSLSDRDIELVAKGRPQFLMGKIDKTANKRRLMNFLTYYKTEVKNAMSGMPYEQRVKVAGKFGLLPGSEGKKVVNTPYEVVEK